MSASRTGSWSSPFFYSYGAATHRAPPQNDIGGVARARESRDNPAEGACSSEQRSAGAAELATRVVELVVDLVLEEHNRRDDGERDQGHEEDVLHHRRSTLVLGE